MLERVVADRDTDVKCNSTLLPAPVVIPQEELAPIMLGSLYS